MQDCLGSRPQIERGALGSVVIAGGVKMKLLAIWFCGNQSMAKGEPEDRLAYFVGVLEADTGVPRDCSMTFHGADPDKEIHLTLELNIQSLVWVEQAADIQTVPRTIQMC